MRKVVTRQIEGGTAWLVRYGDHYEVEAFHDPAFGVEPATLDNGRLSAGMRELRFSVEEVEGMQGRAA